MDLMSDSELQSTTDDLFSTYNLDGFEDTSNPIVPFIGLRNLGNSCFFNSVLQILFYCPGFQKQLAVVAKRVNIEKDDDENNIKQETKDKLKLLYDLHKLFVTMKKNQSFLVNEESIECERENAKAVRPDELMCSLRKVYPAFEPYTQQDAQECLRCILGILDDSMIHLNGKKNESTALVLDEKNCKLMGGRKFGPTSVSSENSRENQDPTRTSVKQESRTTASRKKNMRSLLRKPFKPKSSDSNKTEKSCMKEGPINPLLENTNFLNDADSGCYVVLDKKCYDGNKNHRVKQANDSATLLHTPTKRPNQCDISSLSPPAKRKKLSLCSGIRSFYKPFTSRLTFEKKKSYAVSKPKTTVRKNPFKVLLKTNNTDDYKKLENDKSTDEQFTDSVSDIAIREVKSLKEEVSSNFDDIPMNIEEELSSLNFVEDLFQGKLVNETRCMECESCVYRDEPFMDVSLPVWGNLTTECSKEKNMEEIKQIDDSDDEDDSETNCSVVWGLSAFTSHEILKGDNKYYCEKCHRYVEGARRLQFHSIPPILTFHLKRFTTSKPLGGDSFCTTVSKINSCLNVPLELCLDQWCSIACANRKFKYKLFGIVIHSGVTISSGHYLTYVRLQKSLVQHEYDSATEGQLASYDGSWLEADDESTKVITEKELLEIISPQGIQGVSRTPYLLFYHRENM